MLQFFTSVAFLVNLVGALGRSKFPVIFKSAGKNKQNIKEKM